MNIYVGNLSLEVTEHDLRQIFIIFGEVISVKIMNDKYIGSGQPRGYGYVQMPSRTESQAAIVGLKDKSLMGHPITVIEALPLSDEGKSKISWNKKGKFTNLKTRHR